MFVISDDGVPSEASIIRVQVRSGAELRPVPDAGAASPTRAPTPPRTRRRRRRSGQPGPRWWSGITGLCPYGIGACWAGAYEALRRLERVAYVAPVPDAQASTATLLLGDDGVPPLHRWQEQFVAWSTAATGCVASKSP